MSFPKLHPRHELRNIAESDMQSSILKIIEKYSLSFGEILSILSNIISNWSYALRKEEDKKKEIGKKESR